MSTTPERGPLQGVQSVILQRQSLYIGKCWLWLFSIERCLMARISQLPPHLPESLGGPPMVETMEELLTVQEVATRLRVNEATVRRWIKNGALDAIKLPHRGKREIYRVRRSTLSSVLKDLDVSHT